MRKNSIDYSEVIISAFIFLVFILVVIGATVNGYQAQGTAIDNLVLFTRANNLKAGTCNKWDTDSDGHISCTATNKKDELIQLECASSFYAKDTGSCKLQYWSKY